MEDGSGSEEAGEQALHSPWDQGGWGVQKHAAAQEEEIRSHDEGGAPSIRGGQAGDGAEGSGHCPARLVPAVRKDCGNFASLPSSGSILSGDKEEDMVDSIHAHLKSARETVHHNGQVQMNKFVIT